MKRYPDAIGIGFAKSGTGTMVTFDCHSNIVYSDIEGCAFKPNAPRPPALETYHIPKAHPEEFLIEKSPQYARGDRKILTNTAQRMLDANPNMKLFAFISGYN